MKRIVEAVAVMVVGKSTSGRWCGYLARRRSSSKVYPGWLECPCGKVKRDEYLLDTAVRELREETGIKLGGYGRLAPAGRIRTRGGALFADVELYLLKLRTKERPRWTEPDKRDDWSAYYLDDNLGGMTIATATLWQIARINLGIVTGSDVPPDYSEPIPFG